MWKTLPKISNRNELGLFNFKQACLEVLSFCKSHSLKEGVCVHSPIIKLGLQDQVYLNNNLLSLYAKCSGVGQARQLFDEMPHRDVVSWTGILSAYNKNGDPEEALKLFDLMTVSGEYPNEFTLSSALRSCCSLWELEQGTRIQAYVIKHGFESNPILGSTLIDLYTNCNQTEQAGKVFEYMNNHDTVSWTAMVSSLVHAQRWNQALQLYPHMVEAGVAPNEFTFVKFLASSSFLGLDYGKLVHALLIIWGIKLNLVLKTTLVDMYVKCGRMEDAITVSNQTLEYDVLLWTTIISGFAQDLKFREAISAFHEMEVSGIKPNNYTFSGILNACSSILALELGEQFHSRVIMVGFEGDVSVGNALIDMYARCSHIIEGAFKVFRGIISPNVISWTSLISAFVEHGLEQQSFHSFMEMRALGVEPNSFTLCGVLWACSTIKSLSQTRKLHGYIIKTNPNCDIVVENALVDVYAGLGVVDDAWHVISMMNQRDAVTYTSLATRLNETGFHEMALSVITHMFNDNVKIDEFSLASFLSTSAGLTTMETGKQLHCYSVKSGLGSWISVSNALVDLYGKCGCINDVHKAFREITKPDVVSWNGLIHGLASNGHISLALSAFEDMRLAGVEPDSITFLLVLFTCSHGGLVDLGFDYFRNMRETDNIVPQLDHYVCLVDLLGRAGRLEEALNVIETMPFRPDALIYKTLLNACKLHGNIPLGEDMARKGIQLDPFDPALYVLLANMYDDHGQSDLGDKTRQMMREKGLRKNPGQSWVEIRNQIHSFMAGDRLHPQINEIHGKIESLIAELKTRGYMYQENGDTSYHSEKLAVAFGLLNMPTVAPIRIFKNIRICRDCHKFIMIITQLVDREIIVRDGNRFHSFKKGACSCRGYW
ncbi:pentatricopeptide repeat-containing protein At5g52850, chloroplastic [Malania oleifera]|uniref:pentatricopeptide repeat-containing protein At5g52850, chloroplastic n=1 Tax=Malania oleifera TaxID=397392 RepID=UPI0025AE0449|nr:pentatricopeptide repeat-containing protein At5g52850, chloroplastic [Malania oleifera]